jgi:hypothetical protein
MQRSSSVRIVVIVRGRTARCGALALVLPLVACSGSSVSGANGPAATTTASTVVRASTSVAAASLDACNLLTAEAVSSVFATPVGAPTSNGPGGWIASQCTWASPATGLAVAVAIGTEGSLSAIGISQSVAAFVASRRSFDAAQFTVVDVPNVGDGGYMVVAKAPKVVAFRGDVLVQIIASKRSFSVDPAPVAELARFALLHARG